MPRSLSNPTVPATTKVAVKAKDRDPVAAGQRDASFNRSASFNYFLTDRFEAGVALRGTEVKSIREGKANLKDAYGLLKDDVQIASELSACGFKPCPTAIRRSNT